MSNHHFHRSAGRPAVFASRLAKPECRTTIFTGRPDRLLFCMSAHVFCMSSRQSYTSAAPRHFPEVFLHLGPPFLHVGSRFLHVEPPILHVRRTPAFSRGFFASGTAFFACRLTFLHVGQTYPPQNPTPTIWFLEPHPPLGPLKLCTSVWPLGHLARSRL